MTHIEQIARQVGVNEELVRRVLHFQAPRGTSNDLRKRILEMAHDLRHGSCTGHLRRKDPIRLALVHWYSEEQELEDPYYLSIRIGIERRCLEEGVELLCSYRMNRDDMAMLRDVDGILAVGKFSLDQVLWLRSYSENVIFVDSSPDESKYDSVVVDFLTATESALHYLWSLGHRRIAYIGGREFIGAQRLSIGEKREMVYASFMQERGEFRREDLLLGSFVVESGYQLMKDALQRDSMPSAFFVASDSMAIGVLRALEEAKVRVPEDVSIVSFNDIPAAEHTTPPLTTVRIHTHRMGEVSVQLAIDRLRCGYFVPQKVILSSQLIVRGSVQAYSDPNPPRQSQPHSSQTHPNQPPPNPPRR